MHESTCPGPFAQIERMKRAPAFLCPHLPALLEASVVVSPIHDPQSDAMYTVDTDCDAQTVDDDDDDSEIEENANDVPPITREDRLRAFVAARRELLFALMDPRLSYSSLVESVAAQYGGCRGGADGGEERGVNALLFGMACTSCAAVPPPVRALSHLSFFHISLVYFI